jgi:hypothetical protein
MHQKVRSKLTYSNVVSTLCLFLLLGGAAYAGLRLPKNSVGTKQLKNGAVTNPKLAANAVTADKLAPGAVNPNTLGTVPNASHATNSDEAAHTANSDQLGGLTAAAFVRPSDPIPAGDLSGTYGAPAIKPAEAFHEVPAASLNLCNSPDRWTNYNSNPGNNSTVAFYRDPFGRVYLKGTVKCASSPGANVIFLLPAGYHPIDNENFATPSQTGVAVIYVDHTGFVQLVGGDNPGANGFLELDGISFRCGPSGQSGCP